jgi:hypothetical protein
LIELIDDLAHGGLIQIGRSPLRLCGGHDRRNCGRPGDENRLSHPCEENRLPRP